MNASRWCECRRMGVVGGKLGWERATGRWRKNNLFFWWRGMMSKSRLARCQRNSRTRMSQVVAANQKSPEVSSDDGRHADLAVGRVRCEMEDLQSCHSSVSRQKTQKWDVTVENGFIRIGVRTTYDDSESALSRVSAQPVEILLCHNCHRNYREPSIQIELDLHAYPICRVVVTNVTVQPWAFHRKFSTIQSSQ